MDTEAAVPSGKPLLITVNTCALSIDKKRRWGKNFLQISGDFAEHSAVVMLVVSEARSFLNKHFAYL